MGSVVSYITASLPSISIYPQPIEMSAEQKSDRDGEGSSPSQRSSSLIIVMGVSGAGKSTLGEALAKRLDRSTGKTIYIDADDLHTRSNVEKMARGEPLNDADREPWLTHVRATAGSALAAQDGGIVVVACSALKKYYRDILRGTYRPAAAGDPAPPHDPSALQKHSHPGHEPAHPDSFATYFVYISGTREMLMERISARKGHFMKANMLDSQLAALEVPDTAVVVPLQKTIPEQVDAALEGLKVKGLRFEEGGAEGGDGELDDLD
ncbi:hypothetical protein BOTBODRAFT_60421 [Botryobasidium botryosum FD-172 SS1]|uniref:gluconokinase n=1 Tax=Botryobasidium botryosum (strain FD-172 SS1) TaxID=930990 RepID=A0A067LWZ1_BOTB1|nr:hypothetical protein BOTBODRAFT_60421 [Botryobasidium botryosum FD-172 SS1]